MKKLNQILVLLLITTKVFAQNDINQLNSSMDKFGSALQIINYYYVDSVKQDKLVEDALVGMLEKLDPHSVYVTPKELKEFNEPLSGNFEGVGIQFNILEDTITVISPISGGPSYKVGIMSGDRIVKIEDELVAGVKIKNEQVMKKLRGNKGTKVKVGIFRRGSSEILDFTITRDKIPLYSVDAVYMANQTVGYIKLSRFAQTSSQEVKDGIKKLLTAGAKDIIFDLQDNGGGFLNTAFEIADEFLGSDKLIVYTKGIHSPKKDYVATNKGDFEKGRLVILVDEGSASASEILSGSIQDWDRGLLVGRRTFGKGLVQNQYPLPDGSALRLTIAEYFTPTGRCIQRPYGKGTENYYKDLYNRYKNGELTNPDSIKFPDSLKFKTNGGRLVYGGGGIMPDVFIPIDTTKSSKYLTDLIRKGILNQFALSYVDRNRKKLNETYPTFEKFKSDFVVDKLLVDELIKKADSEGVKFDEKNFETSKQVIYIQLKALVARDIYGNESFFELINQLNDSYLKALDLLKNDDAFKKYKIRY